MRELGLPKTQIKPANSKDQYPTYTGRTIFEQLTISGFNRLPVLVQDSWATTGAKYTETSPFTPSMIAQAGMIEGGLVATLDESGDWILQRHVMRCTEKVIQQIVPGESVSGVVLENFLREYIQDKSGNWSVTLYRVLPTGSREMIGAPVGKPGAELRHIPSDRGLDSGILHPNQWAYQRLEEIRWSIRRETSEFALSILIIGLLGTDPEAALQKLESGRRVANIPGKGIEAVRVGDSRVVDQLRSEYAEVAGTYMMLCSITDTGQVPERPVGYDLLLRLQPQINYVEKVRGAVSDFLALFGVKISYREIMTASPQDTQAKIYSITEAYNKGLLEREQAATLVFNTLSVA